MAETVLFGESGTVGLKLITRDTLERIRETRVDVGRDVVDMRDSGRLRALFVRDGRRNSRLLERVGGHDAVWDRERGRAPGDKGG
jgi:hypothetical protein